MSVLGVVISARLTPGQMICCSSKAKYTADHEANLVIISTPMDICLIGERVTSPEMRDV